MQKYMMQPQPGQAGPGQTPPAVTALQPPPSGGWPVGPGPVGIVVPGGDAPTQANFQTALTGTAGAPVGGAAGSLAGDINAQIAANLGRILGFATGGG
jgi:hypothetical protein